jgi:hypothetical protein
MADVNEKSGIVELSKNAVVFLLRQVVFLLRYVIWPMLMKKVGIV